MKIKSAISLILLLFALFCACSTKQSNVKKVNPIQVQCCSVTDSSQCCDTKILVHYSLAYPVSDSMPVSMLKNIQQNAIRPVVGEIANDTPQIALANKVKEIINEYNKRFAEWNNNPLADDEDCIYYRTDKIENSVTQTVTFNQDNILSIETKNDVRYGALQPNVTLSYNNFNLLTGEVLSYNSLFIEDSEDIVSAFIINQIMKDNDVTQAKELENIGFIDISSIKPSTSFSLNDEGVTFVYNPSEIAIASLGVIKVFIPYKELNFIIKEEAVIANFVD